MANNRTQVASSIERLLEPPDQYTKQYMEKLVSSVNALSDALSRGISVTATNLSLPSLATDSTPLRANQVYLMTLKSGEKVLSVVIK